MAKKKSTPINRSKRPLRIEKNVPIAGIFGRSAAFTYPEEYALIDSMENGDSVAFDTASQHKIIHSVKNAVTKASGHKKKFLIKKVDAQNSRIWRKDGYRKFYGNRYTGAKKKSEKSE